MIEKGLTRIGRPISDISNAMQNQGQLEVSKLEKNLNILASASGAAPMLGFLGTVVGMVMAFDDIQRAGDMSPTIVAGGMKVALITTVFGLIVALILQIFYNYILSKLEGILNRMEDASITLLDQVVKYNVKHKNL